MRQTPTVELWPIAVIGVALILAFGLAGNISGTRSIDPIIQGSVCMATTESFISINGGPAASVQFDVDIELDPFYEVNQDMWLAAVALEIQKSAFFNMNMTTEGAPAPSDFTLTSISPNGEFFPANAFGQAWFLLTHDAAADTLHQDPTTPFEIMNTKPLDTFPQDSASYYLVSPVVFGNQFGDTVVIESGTVTVTGHYFPGEPIPTLTEWSMIIFSVLLLAFMAWMLIHGRKRTTLRI